jgi:hypothetical protein
VGGAVFKTVERQSLSLVGSIPIRLRHLRFCSVRRLLAAIVGALVDLRVPFACHNSRGRLPIWRLLRPITCRIMRFAGLGVAVVVSALLSAACTSSSSSPQAHSSTTATASATAQTEVAAALSAARAAGSVHYILKTPLKGGVFGTTTGDVSNAAGRQTIQNPDGGSVATYLVDGNAYFRGNATGLISVGIPAASANRLAGKWIIVRGASPLFHAVVDQVTLDSVLRYIDPMPPLGENAAAGSQFGQPVTEVSGGIPHALVGGPAQGRSLLYISTTDRRPVAFDYISERTGSRERWRFAITPRPHPRSRLMDALLAAIAEKLADDNGLPRPGWTRTAPKMRPEWVAPGTPRMQAEYRRRAPRQLLERGLVIDGQSLWRDRATVGV